MDDDPWFWPLVRVVDFFRHYAAAHIRDLPNGRLPDQTPFLQVLTDNDVSGAVLLTAVDAAFLRVDCNILSLGVRSAVLHCIRKLRSQSREYARQNGFQADPTSIPLIALPDNTSTPSQPLKATTAEDVGQTLRNGELRVEDIRGRQRRKLVLSAQEPSQPPSVEEVPKAHGGYLRDASLSIDELFFGSTALGTEMDHQQPDGEILEMGIADLQSNGTTLDMGIDGQQPVRGAPSLGDDRDDAMDNFQFQLQHKTCGERHYVWSQMRHFLNNENATEFQRHGRPAAAILPYREALLPERKPRSAIVFQIPEDRAEAIAVRENAAFAQSVHGYHGLAQTSTSNEWDFLLQKHNNTEELPVYGGSLEEEISSSLADELDAEELERAQAAQGLLSKSQISDIIDNVVGTFVEVWKQRLPRFEEKHARKIWRQMKSSKSLRNALIEDAAAQVSHLNRRLARYKATYLLDDWRSESDLRQTCEIMRVTVEDREELLWKKDIWQRRRQPSQTMPHRHESGSTVKTANHLAHTRFVVEADDRLSLSPAAKTMPYTAAYADVATKSLPVEMDPSRSENVVGTESTDLPESEKTPTDLDLSQDEERVSHSVATGLRHQGEVPPSSPQANQDAQPPAKDSFPELSKGRPGSEDLPDLSSFVSQQSKRDENIRMPITPRRSSGASRVQVDLTMVSSDSSTPSKKVSRPPSNRIDYTEYPLLATSEQVKSWDIEELSKRQDRLRLLIKILFSAGADYRDTLLHGYRQLRRQNFIDQLKLVLRKMSGANFDKGALQPEYNTIMSECASLAVAWLLCKPDAKAQLLSQSQWIVVLKDELQFAMFVDQLANILRKNATSLFHTPEKRQNLQPIVLSSDDDRDDAPAHETPHKKRKRVIQASEAAKRARTQAFERQEKFRSAMQLQSSNSKQLIETQETGNSTSHIAINPTKDDDKDSIYILPNIASKIKAHQLDGVRFMWREITNDGSSGEQGCILAHTMGLGKTMQTIAVLAAVNEAALSTNQAVRLQLPPGLRPKGIRNQRQLRMLVLSPPALLQNWRREIDQWAPNAFGNVFIVEAAQSGVATRIGILEDWHRFGGVLLISYDLFRTHVFRKDSLKAFEDKLDQILLHDPEIVIADEAHVLKNDDSLISKAARRLRTESRIGLTGTPMSNDVHEIYALISFVAPGFLGASVEFRALFAEPIAQGTYADSTSTEIRKSIKKLAVLRHDIEPKVNRADITVLRGSLKSKVEFVITLPLTSLQRSVYNTFIDHLTLSDKDDKASQMRIFGWLAVLTVLTNHPLAFKKKLLNLSQNRPKRPKRAQSPEGFEGDTVTPAMIEAGMHMDDAGDATMLQEDIEEADTEKLGFSDETVKALVEVIPDDVDPCLSVKVFIFIKILALSRHLGDKVLVFTSSIPTLNYLSELLTTRKILFGRIDGHVQTGRRLAVVEDFNQGNCEVMLVSTRAGGTGLNIQSANRVVIFDFGFNPAWEEQAIGRAYRLGQTKPVYVYRFVAGGTFEDKIYDKQLFKTSLALRVVDKKNPRRNAVRNMRDYIYKPREIEPKDLTPWTGKDSDVLDRIIAERCPEDPRIVALSTMETLQEDAGDVPLTEEERKEVNEEIEVVRHWRVMGRRAGPGSAAGSSTFIHASSVPPSTAPAAVVPHQIVTQPSRGPPSQPGPRPEQENRKLYLGGLPTM